MFPPDCDWREALATVAARVDEIIEGDIATLEENTRNLVAEFNRFSPICPDFLREATYQYPRSGGKRMRAALTLWTCGLYGGDPEKALNAAVAVELYHNWTLVHDDLIDNDDTRRGEPSVHTGTAAKMRALGKSDADSKMLGDATAILAGDLLQAWATTKILAVREAGVSADCALELVKNMHEYLGYMLIGGEMTDVELSTRPWETITTEEVIHMISGKTSALINYAARCGQEIAEDTTGKKLNDNLSADAFTDILGMTFQLRDDWLGLYGDEEQLGKPIGSDLIAKKPTLLFTIAFERLDDAGRAELSALAGNPAMTKADLQRARELVTSCGAENIVNGMMQAVKTGQKYLDKYPDSKYKTWLKELLDYAVARDK